MKDRKGGQCLVIYDYESRPPRMTGAIQESSGGGEDTRWKSAQCLQRGSDTGDDNALIVRILI